MPTLLHSSEPENALSIAGRLDDTNPYTESFRKDVELEAQVDVWGRGSRRINPRGEYIRAAVYS